MVTNIKQSALLLDVCNLSSPPPIGTLCKEGPIYAGSFDGGNYMITPGNCTDSATPSCDDSPDSLTKVWRGSSGSDADIAGVENITGTATSSSSFRGDVNTAAIVADASTSSDSATDYCNDMTYGGHSDWYLPSKSELSFLYCHAVATHNPSYPQENVDCVSFGGKQNILTGFTGSYWSSTEYDSSRARNQRFSDGYQTNSGKVSSLLIRCVRRY